MLITVLFAVVVVAYSLAQATDTASISVSVSSVTMIDINPASFSFTVGPGQSSTSQFFQIENIGSATITNVYASVTTTSSNPYGTGVASNYNAGEFVRIDNTTSGPFYYVENKNWNESKPAYVTVPSNWAEGSPSASSWGYFIRIRSVGLETIEGEEYFAITLNTSADTTNPCTGTPSGKAIIGRTPHTKSQTGTIVLDTAQCGTDCEQVNGGSSTTNVNTVFNAHTIKISSDCKAISLVYWVGTGNGGNNLFGGTLAPGAAKDMRIMVSVPYGVASGTITGTLTITAS